MIRLSKIYTKSGDKGQTSLVGGSRVWKHSIQVEAFGTIDELNAHIGLLRTIMIENDYCSLKTLGELRVIQNYLFDIGYILSCDLFEEPDKELDPEAIGKLEEAMDEYQKELEPLTSFVLPGGSSLNAHAHIARTVCRRAERELFRLSVKESVPEDVLSYINRLSDYLFVFSRWAISAKNGANEFLWDNGNSE